MASIQALTVATDIELQSIGGNTEYALADGTNLPFKSNTFEFVFCNHVLEHIDDKNSLLQEIRRVLQPGGEALFAFPNRLSLHAPHSLPGWYSFLPKQVGIRLAPIFLDEETVEYYKSSEYMLSPILARYLLHYNFDKVEYVVFDNKKRFGGNSQRTGIGGIIQKLVNRNAGLISRITDIPVIGHVIELFYPPVAYRCTIH